MAIEINNNTVIRLIVRRGSQSDLDFATLAQGELGYAVDTKRLFIGMNNSQGIAGVTVAGNKYLGAVPRGSIQNAFYGDYVFDTASRRLYVYDTAASSSWVDVSPDQVSVASDALSANNNVITFNPDYLNASNNTVRIGKYDDSISSLAATLVSRGQVLILPVTGNTNNISLSANQTRGLITLPGSDSVINLGTSGSIVGTDTINLSTNGTNGDKNFIIKNGLRNAAMSAASASPSFVLSGGCVKVEQLVCTNDLVVQGLVFCTATAILSSVSSVVIDITDVQTAPLTGLRVLDKNTVHDQWLCTMAGSTNTVFAAKNLEDTSGFVGINDSNRYLNSNFTVSGNQYYHGSTFTVATKTITLSSSVTVHGDLSATGDIIGFTASDERLKNNVTPIANALKKLLALKGVEFDWAAVDTMPRTGHDVGLIAQDVIKQVPEAVGTRHDGYYGVYYEKIIPLLVEAIRELDSKIK